MEESKDKSKSKGNSEEGESCNGYVDGYFS